MDTFMAHPTHAGLPLRLQVWHEAKLGGGVMCINAAQLYFFFKCRQYYADGGTAFVISTQWSGVSLLKMSKHIEPHCVVVGDQYISERIMLREPDKRSDNEL